ncbi:Peptidase family M48 family protein [Euphorbia peplus]|nr:Peptidase family M48 family protein [Euphorbia peplus]
MKTGNEGNILPEIHPESVKVRLIANQIIEALERGLKQENVSPDRMSYSGFGNADDDTLEMQIKFLMISKFCVQLTTRKTRKKGSIAETSHLDGLNWEVIVVNDPKIKNAFCLPGGKILVFKRLLEFMKTDAEIATVIAHEVGHLVARHNAEWLTVSLWFEILKLAAYKFGMPHPCLVKIMIKLFLRLPSSRRT